MGAASRAPEGGWAKEAKLAAVVAIWLWLAGHLLGIAAQHAPMWLKKLVDWSTFRALIELATLGVGVAATWIATRDAKETLGWKLPSFRGGLSAIVVSPGVFVLSSQISIAIALPTLMEELERRGAGASRQNAGSFGREIESTSIVMTIVSGAILAAFSEEILFRGALWTAVNRLTAPFSPRCEVTEAEAIRGEGLSAKAGRVLSDGGIATIVSAAIFGWMHHDLPGGVGIVRVVSTTILGAASGTLRHATRSVLPCIALHLANNLLALGQAHGLLTYDATWLVAAGVVGFLIAFALGWTRRREERMTAA